MLPASMYVASAFSRRHCWQYASDIAPSAELATPTAGWRSHTLHVRSVVTHVLSGDVPSDGAGVALVWRMARSASRPWGRSASHQGARRWWATAGPVGRTPCTR